LGFLKRALAEDLGRGDITTKLLIPEKKSAEAFIVSKAYGIFSGSLVAQALVKMVKPSLQVHFEVKDGQKIKPKQKILRLKGNLHSILKIERALLNYLAHLSGVATKTYAFVGKVKSYETLILDTRKTTPLMRELEKRAVCAGGGGNHRFGLDSYVLVKENHRKFGDLKKLQRVKQKFEIEVRDLKELHEALKLSPQVVMLDNFTPEQAKKAVRIVRDLKAPVIIEASGGIHLKNVRQYAKAGVDAISLGSLTHSVESLDLSLLVK